ncbi:hypothetical protein [Amycolatopsis sp. 195334CR]|uniref:hypothetical protein n=1 Tax=Amycolatopsis sp. 195334CR TaxID=2814588 RepID=UPI001A8E7255|nr:hypothetical protein [Amycolatopsis sp. 195334CR]MBN6040076.1 hypothetical protein [Amycolatopsis sp. 195334CR]
MTSPSADDCPRCAPHQCMGTAMHTIEDALRDGRHSPRILARLLTTTPQALSAMSGWDFVRLLRDLKLGDLSELASYLGISPQSVHAALLGPTSTETPDTPAALRAALIAVVFTSLPTGLYPQDLEQRLGCDDAAIFTAIQDVIRYQPPGLRLYLSGDGRVLLGPDHACLPPPPGPADPTPHSRFRLTDADLAASLWHLCQHHDPAGIPAQHLQQLLDAGLVATDGQAAYPTLEVTHSLQFY